MKHLVGNVINVKKNANAKIVEMNMKKIVFILKIIILLLLIRLLMILLRIFLLEKIKTEKKIKTIILQMKKYLKKILRIMKKIKII